MQNDKLFAVYALTLVAVVAAAITTAVTNGIASLPSFTFVAEHVGLGLMFRASYKSIGGFDWLLPGAEESSAVETVDVVGGQTADAMS